MLHYLDSFFDKRLKGGIPTGGSIAAIWAVQYIAHLCGIEDLRLGKLLLSVALDICLLQILYMGTHVTDLLKKLFFLSVFYIFLALSQAAAVVFLSFRLGRPVPVLGDYFGNPVENMGAYVISIVLLIPVLVFCERFRKVEAAKLERKNWLFLLLMPIVSILFVWYLYPYTSETLGRADIRILSAVSFLILLFNLYILFIYRNIAHTQMLRYRFQLLRSYCEYQRKHQAELFSSQRLLQDTVHDYLHNLGLIVKLIEQDREQEAAAYIYKLESRIKQSHVMKYTGNRDVDAILSGKFGNMAARNIFCKVSGTLPAELPFDILDLCILLSNALDNAFEACLRQELTGRLIEITFRYSKKSLILIIRNPYAPEQAGPRKERDSGAHGRGIAIMREVVETYHGLLEHGEKQGYYEWSAFLQAPLDDDE